MKSKMTKANPILLQDLYKVSASLSFPCSYNHNLILFPSLSPNPHCLKEIHRAYIRRKGKRPEVRKGLRKTLQWCACRPLTYIPSLLPQVPYDDWISGNEIWVKGL